MQPNLLLLILACVYFQLEACTLCDSCFLACLSCTPNSSSDYWISTQCNCNPGFYDNAGSTCPPCDATCLTCSGPSNSECLSCGSHATLASGKCPCDPGYYFDGTTCLPCDVECLTCSAAGSSGCLTCYNHASLSLVAPSNCQCNTGWWPDTLANNCSPCSNLCRGCTNANSSSCTLCKSGAALIGTAPTQCVCSQTYFPHPDAASCAPCDLTCLGCSGFGPSSCLSCKLPAVLQVSICKCPSNTFPSPDASNCVFCAAECLTCSGATAGDCMSCKGNASLWSTPGTCSCNGGFFGSPSACVSCDSTCLTCSGGTISSCLLCHPHASLQGGTSPNLCICDDSFFPNPTSAICPPCDITCFNCNNSTPTSCTACYPNAELYQSLNPGKCICLSSYFPNPDTGHCAICDQTCTRCVGSGALLCTLCSVNAQLEHNLSPGKCLCSDAYFPNPTAALCTQCNSTCLLCTGPTASHCSSCHDFAALASPVPSLCQCVSEAFTLSDSSHCALCSPLCQTCTGPGPNQCSACKFSAYLQSPAPSGCVCNSGSFPNPDVSLCSPCALLCQSCSSVDQCLECKEGGTLASGKCTCAQGFYVGEDGGSCGKCSDGCGKCISTGCSECTSGYFLISGNCVTSCPIGYALVSNSCQLSTPPVPSLSSDLNNTLYLSFTQAMNCSLTSLDISLHFQPVDSSNLAWQDPVPSDSQNFLIYLNIGENYMPNGTIANLTFLNPESVLDVDGVSIEVNWVTANMHGFGSPTSSTPALLASPAASQSAAVSKGGVSAGVATSLMNGNPSSILSLVNQLQIVTYLAMSKIPIPEEFASTLAGMNVGQMIPNPTANIAIFTFNDSSQTPPQYIQNYGLNTLLFIANAKSVLTTSALILLSYLPIYLLSKVPAKPFRRYFQGLLQSLRWSVPVNIWLTSYLDLAVFSLLQVANMPSSFQSYLPGLSSCLAICMLLAILISPICLLIFLKRNWTKVVTRTDTEFNKRWGALLTAFKPSNHLSSVAYYPLFLVRRLTLAVTLTLIPDRVYLLACLNTSLALLFTLYVLIFRPHLDPLDILDASTSELSTFLIYAIGSSFVLDMSDATRNTLSTIGAWVAKGTIAVAMGVSVTKTAVGVWQVLKLYREHTKGKYLIRTLGQESEITTHQSRLPTADISRS